HTTLFRSDMNRHLPLQVRQTKIHSPVAAESRPQQTEQCLVLIDRQQLAVTQRPPFRGEAKTEDSDFRKKWFGHSRLLHRVSNREVSSVVRSRKETGWVRTIQQPGLKTPNSTTAKLKRRGF